MFWWRRCAKQSPATRLDTARYVDMAPPGGVRHPQLHIFIRHCILHMLDFQAYYFSRLYFSGMHLGFILIPTKPCWIAICSTWFIFFHWTGPQPWGSNSYLRNLLFTGVRWDKVQTSIFDGSIFSSGRSQTTNFQRGLLGLHMLHFIHMFSFIWRWFLVWENSHINTFQLHAQC